MNSKLRPYSRALLAPFQFQLGTEESSSNTLPYNHFQNDERKANELLSIHLPSQLKTKNRTFYLRRQEQNLER